MRGFMSISSVVRYRLRSRFDATTELIITSGVLSAMWLRT